MKLIEALYLTTFSGSVDKDETDYNCIDQFGFDPTSDPPTNQPTLSSSLWPGALVRTGANFANGNQCHYKIR
jgi:hypothetical protein